MNKTKCQYWNRYITNQYYAINNINSNNRKKILLLFINKTNDLLVIEEYQD